MEVWFDAVEVRVDPVKGGYKGLLLAPMGVLVDGSFSRESSPGRCFCRAEMIEEVISGRRVTSCQG